MIKQQLVTSKKVQHGGASTTYSRNGEGQSVALAVVQIDKNRADGVDAVKYGIDLMQAPVPPRRYAAELASARVLDNELRFLFAMRTVSGDALESVLIVRFNPDAARSLIRSIKEMEKPTIAEILNTMGAKKESPQDISKNPQNPGNVANMIANFAAIAVSGYETAIDFYHASAFAMRSMAETKSLDMDPKVRVDIRTSLFAGLMDQAERLIGELSQPNFEVAS